MTVILTADPTFTAPALKLRPWKIEDADALVRAQRMTRKCAAGSPPR